MTDERVMAVDDDGENTVGTLMTGEEITVADGENTAGADKVGDGIVNADGENTIGGVIAVESAVLLIVGGSGAEDEDKAADGLKTVDEVKARGRGRECARGDGNTESRTAC
jgi:hypothetical protein